MKMAQDTLPVFLDDNIDLTSSMKKVEANIGRKKMPVDYNNCLFDEQFAPSVQIKVEPDIPNICPISPEDFTEGIDMESIDWSCSPLPQLPELVQEETMQTKQTYDVGNDPVLQSSQVNYNFSSFMPTAKKQFLCNICQYKSSFGQAGVKCTHFDVNSSSDFENESLFSLSSLSEGLESQTKDKEFCCNICQFKCLEKNIWDSHLLTHKEEIKTYTCKTCSYTCESEIQLVLHMDTHSKHEQFSWKINVDKQRGSLKMQMTKNAEEKMYTCNMCDYKCSKAILKTHKVTHTKVKKIFYCDVCQYSSFRNADLRKHMRIHSGDKPYGCTICDYSSTRRGNLETHMRKHTGERPLRCSMCRYKTFGEFAMANHERTHTEDTPYWCNACDFKCSDGKVLKTHMVKLHPKAKKILYCDICQYCTTRRERIDRHKLAHTGEKPFWCDLCSYKSIRKEHLVNHMHRHFGRKPLS